MGAFAFGAGYFGEYSLAGTAPAAFYLSGAEVTSTSDGELRTTSEGDVRTTSEDELRTTV